MALNGRVSLSQVEPGRRLHADSNGRSGGGVAEIQRARMLAAAFEVVAERGAGSVSIAHMLERSGVSRRTFYEAFDDREDCLLAAFEEAVAYTSERVLPAYSSQRKWRDQIRAGLLALLTFLDEEPAIGRLLVMESLAAGPRVVARRDRALQRVIRAIDAGREESRSAAALPPLTAEGVVGGVLSVLHSRMARKPQEPLVELASSLMSMIAMPYLGSAAARRELDRPVQAPASPRAEGSLLSDPFKEAGMRLTYRTVRVLMTIADNPCCSNRVVGEQAEIKDQGQISKLLTRLQRIGLVSNTGLGPGQGAPNAWSLTPKGRQVAHSIRAHTDNFNPISGSHGPDEHIQEGTAR
jgi:AcrR family transcriptional regulator/DNA-binding MarR family transcriptional regulator